MFNVSLATAYLNVSQNYFVSFSKLSSSQMPARDLDAGLLDQRMALEFVRDNAATFGGDGSKITIWGHSGGRF